MQGTIVNFRGGRHTQYNNQMIIAVDGVDSTEKAKGLVGKTVTWKSPAAKELKGKVASSHGSNGAVRAIFETGMPGQSVSTRVDIS